MAKKKIVCRSFRIREEWNEVLEEEAKKQRIGVNALMNKLLQEYSIFHRHTKNYGAITLSHKAFARILGGCSEEWIKSITEELGSTVPKDGMIMMGLPLDRESLVFVISNLGELGGHYKVISNRENGKRTLHLRHNLGRKWSLYLAGTISKMFKSVSNTEVETEMFDNYVTIVFNT